VAAPEWPAVKTNESDLPWHDGLGSAVGLA
jgi:hypothetical protein